MTSYAVNGFIQEECLSPGVIHVASSADVFGLIRQRP